MRVLCMNALLKHDLACPSTPMLRLAGSWQVCSAWLPAVVCRQLLKLSLPLAVLPCTLFLKDFFILLEDGKLIVTSLLREFCDLDLVDSFSEIVSPALQFRKLLYLGK